MTTAIDTNVIVALWDPNDSLNSSANSALGAAVAQGAAIISGPVFAELLALPGERAHFLDEFLRDTGVAVDWDFDEAIWRTAGLAFQSYSRRRRRQERTGPRRILADFLIGAHAFERGYRLLTLDQGLYHLAFPRLEIQSV